MTAFFRRDSAVRAARKPNQHKYAIPTATKMSAVPVFCENILIMIISEKGEIMEKKEILQRRRTELAAFLFLAVFLAPFIAVAGIGGYGLFLWLMQ